VAIGAHEKIKGVVMNNEKDLSALKNTWIFWIDFAAQHPDLFKTPLALKWYLRQNSEVLAAEGAIAYENKRRVMIKPDIFFIARNKILESKPVHYLYPWRNKAKGTGI
jgi:hypothetical protein